MCRLFIENVEVDLDESVQFAITRQLEDITNPTTIINSWSKTVEIPFTIHNNELFGSIFSPDRIPVSSATLNTGIYFNPLKKMDFRLQYDDMVVMVGYGKMTEIKRESDKDVYCVTLFGELGKVLSEMKKITFDTTSDDTDYIIDGSYYVNEMIDRYLINDSWTSTGQTTPNVASGQSFTNYIGFAPNNSYCPNFDYKTFQRASGESYTFTEALDERSFSEHTGIDSSTAIDIG